MIDDWLRVWLRAGLDYEAFWRRTPREIAVILEAAVDRARDRHESGRAIAYEAARLTAFAFHDPRHVPPYKAMAVPGRHADAPRSDEADQARVRAYFIALSLRTGGAAELDGAVQA